MTSFNPVRSIGDQIGEALTIHGRKPHSVLRRSIVRLLEQVGIVNAVTGRGRHTSTSAYLLELPDGDGWIIDTPGIRSFGLAHVKPENLISAFPDLDEMTEDCPRGCSHGTGEPECGLDEAVAEGTADPDRVESFRRLLSARESASDW